jgi:hypothetical protein
MPNKDTNEWKSFRRKNNLGDFDHLDDAGVDIPRQYEARLAWSTHMTQLGFHAYHVRTSLHAARDGTVSQHVPGQRYTGDWLIEIASQRSGIQFVRHSRF